MLKISKSIKSSVLSYVIVVSILLFSICMSFILVHKDLDDRYNEVISQNRIHDNTLSTVNVINSGYDIPTNSNITLSLFKNKDDSVIITNRKWGIYDLYFITFCEFGRVIKRVGLWGGVYDYEKNISFFVSSNSKPITLSKNVIVIGNLEIPGGYVDGMGKLGENIKFAKSKVSAISFIDGKVYNLNFKLDSIIKLENINSINNFKNSFLKTTVFFKVNSNCCFDNLVVSGNVSIISDGSITIKSTSKLDNIIVAAKKVVVEDNFTGRLQIYASDSIVVGRNVVLKYPSSLICTTNDACINIMQNSKVCGGVVLLNNTDINTSKGIISISNSSKIYGLIFSAFNVDCKGFVEGALYCNRFLSEKRSMYYENSVDSLILNETQLPSYFAMPSILNHKKRKFICWLR